MKSLGCAEFTVPGETLAEKLEVLESRGLWLELVNDGRVAERLGEIREALASFKVEVRSVQAYLQHKLSPLSSRAQERKAAIRHLEESIQIASAVGAQNVVAVLTYGSPGVGNPREASIKVFKRLGELGANLGVIISIEALGRPRTSFLPSVAEVCKLVGEMGSSHIRAMADTAHMHENGDEVVETLRNYLEDLEEIHLRDTESRPPGAGEIDFHQVLEAMRGFKGLACLEYLPGPNPQADLALALQTIGATFGARLSP